MINEEVIKRIRSDFPQLSTQVNKHPLVYLDNAATTLKPKVMIEALTQHYSFEVSNVHRGVHTLSEMGTRAFEETRLSVQKLINAKEAHEIISWHNVLENAF